MKKTLIFILTAIMVLQLFSFTASAQSTVEITATEYKTAASGVLINSSGKSINIKKGMYTSYDVNFTDKPTFVELSMNSDDYHVGIVTIRLGSPTGEVLAQINPKPFMQQTYWSKIVCSAKIEKAVTGPQTIFICYNGVQCDIHGAVFYLEEEGVQNRMTSLPLDNQFTDIDDDENKSEINLLAQLGIIDKTETAYIPALPMTRESFSALLGIAIGADEFVREDVPFADVAKTNPNFKLINGLYGMGIVNGDGTGNFKPYDFIGVNEALTMVSRVLGYSFREFSELELMTLARRLKLLRGVDISTGYLNNSSSAALIYNMLLCDYLEIQGIGDDEITYEPENNTLKKYSDIIYGSGVVTENAVTGLYNAKNRDDVISIEDEKFLPGKTDINSCLGVLCDYFYSEKNGVKTLLAIAPSEEVTITTYETSLENSLVSLSERGIEYYEGEKEHEYKLDSKTAIIYNGIALDTPLSNLVSPKDFLGRITIIDNDSDRKADCVWIDKARNAVAGGVSDTAIYDKLTGTKIDSEDVSFELYLGGEHQMLKNVEENTVLSVYESVNKKGDKLVRVNSKLLKKSGVISLITDDCVTIDDIEYKISDDCMDEIYVGMEAEYHLNDYGQIVYVNPEEIQPKVGYLLEIGVEQTSAFDLKPKVKLLTEEGIVIAETANRIIADGVIIKDNKDFYNGKDKFVGLKNLAVNVPVLYQIDADGKICMLDSKEKGTGNKNDGLTKMSEAEPFRYYGGVLSDANWRNKYPLKSSAKVIQLTADGKEENYMISTGLSIGDNQYSFTPYSYEPDSIIADILVWENCTTNQNKWKNPFVFDKLTQVYDEKQDCAAWCLNGYSVSGNEKYIVDADIYNTDADLRKLISSLRSGDLVQLALTQDRVSSVEIVFLNDGSKTNSAGIEAVLTSAGNRGPVGGTSKGRMFSGTVLNVEDGYLVFEFGNGTRDAFNFSSASVASVKISDTGKAEVTSKLTSKNVFPGDFIIGYEDAQTKLMTRVYVYKDITMN